MPSKPYYKELKEQLELLKNENRELSNTIESLKNRLQELDKKANELREQNLRFSADVENLQKATDAKIREMEKVASARIINELLPILDSLDNAHDDSAKILRSQFLNILKKEGLEVIDSSDVPFDPNVHEAIGILEGMRDGYVGKIVRNGYKFNGRLLRPALVLIGKEVK